MYDLPQKLPNDLRLRILGNYGISRKSLKWLELKASAQLATKNEIFDNCAKKMQKSSLKYFTGKPILLDFENLSTMLFPR